MKPGWQVERAREVHRLLLGPVPTPGAPDGEAAKCEYSVKQLAALLEVSPSMLYKHLEWDERRGGPRAPMPVHLLPRWIELTGDASVLEWLCHQCGKLLVDAPADADFDERGVRRLTARFAETVDEILAAVDPAGPGGRCVTVSEAKKVRKACRQLAQVAEGLAQLASFDAEQRGRNAGTINAGTEPRGPREARAGQGGRM